MPLSEHEEHILAEIERQLEAEDPRFAARSRRTPTTPLTGWSPTLRLRAAIGLGIVGIICVLSLAFSFAIAAVGMVLLLTAIILGGTAVRDSLRTQAPRRTPSPDDAL